MDWREHRNQPPWKSKDVLAHTLTPPWGPFCQCWHRAEPLRHSLFSTLGFASPKQEILTIIWRSHNVLYPVCRTLKSPYLRTKYRCIHSEMNIHTLPNPYQPCVISPGGGTWGGDKTMVLRSLDQLLACLKYNQRYS